LHFNFLFVPCGRLSWLPVSFLLHVKHTLSYRKFPLSLFQHYTTGSGPYYGAPLVPLATAENIFLSGGSGGHQSQIAMWWLPHRYLVATTYYLVATR